MKTPILETQRLILRPLTIADAETVYTNWASDADVAKYMRWDLNENVDETRAWLVSEEASLLADDAYGWGFVLKENGMLMGSGGLQYQESIDCFSLGYNIMKRYWNRGLTTEAGAEMLRFATQTLRLHKFECCHAVENIGSMRVMTKLGFQFWRDGKYDSFSGKKHFASKEYLLEV
ncbi:MAG: GNAT family N-acetyltransferase [Ruthenibacterium sp.]